jgi:hypothetical protein
MRYFIVHYQFRKGLGPEWEPRQTEVAFDDIDPETTDAELIRMAQMEVNTRFERSDDYRLYGKFWEITDVEEINY